MNFYLFSSKKSHLQFAQEFSIYLLYIYMDWFEAIAVYEAAWRTAVLGSPKSFVAFLIILVYNICVNSYIPLLSYVD